MWFGDSCTVTIIKSTFSRRAILVFHDKNGITQDLHVCKYGTNFWDLMKNQWFIAVLMRNHNGQKMIQQNIPHYDENIFINCAGRFITSSDQIEIDQLIQLIYTLQICIAL